PSRPIARVVPCESYPNLRNDCCLPWTNAVAVALAFGLLLPLLSGCCCACFRVAVALAFLVVIPEGDLLLPFTGQGKPPKNKSQKSEKFSALKKHHPKHHNSPATHHKFTSKKPRSAHHFPQKPLQKPPSANSEKNHSRGSSIRSKTCAI